MSDHQSERVGRRTFLNRVAVTAGAARLSPTLLAAAVPAAASLPNAEEGAAQTTPRALAGYTTRLAQYASSLRYEDVPAQVRQRIKDCITDTVAAILYGCAKYSGVKAREPEPVHGDEAVAH